ncbi:MAG: DUF2059 domain-containing protein [Chthoniobacterales bacterium]
MIKRILIILALTCASLSAADPAPSDASIRELLDLTGAKKILDTVLPQMQSMTQASIREATKGQPPTPEQQKLIDRSLAQMQTVMQEELAWNKLEPMYLRIYRQSLTQSEVTGMIAFYKTPIGQAVITKMPLIMQNTMTEMQGMMGPMMQRMQQAQAELAAQIEAEQKSAKTKH